MREDVKELMQLFNNSFINQNNELILVPRTNLYFRLDDVNNYQDLCYKIFAWCSRDCSKSEPYYAKWRNEKYREYVRNNINTFLGVDYNENDWLDIYSKYGNGCNKNECIEFIKNITHQQEDKGE